MAHEVLHSASVPPAMRNEKHLSSISAFLQNVPELSHLSAAELRRYSVNAQLLEFQPNALYRIPKSMTFVVVQGSLFINGTLFMESRVFRNVSTKSQDCLFLEPTSLLTVNFSVTHSTPAPPTSPLITKHGTRRSVPPPLPPPSSGLLSPSQSHAFHIRRPNSPPDYASACSTAMSSTFSPPLQNKNCHLSSTLTPSSAITTNSGVSISVPAMDSLPVNGPDESLDHSINSSKMLAEEDDLEEDVEDPLDDFSLSSVTNESTLESRFYEALAKSVETRSESEIQSIIDAVSNFSVFSQMSHRLRYMLCSKARLLNLRYLGSVLLDYMLQPEGDVVNGGSDWMVVLQGTLVVQHSYNHALDHYLKPGDVINISTYKNAFLPSQKSGHNKQSQTPPQGKIRIVSSTDDCALLSVNEMDYETCLKQALVDRQVCRCSNTSRILAVTESRSDLHNLNMTRNQTQSSLSSVETNYSTSNMIIIMATPEHLLNQLLGSAENMDRRSHCNSLMAEENPLEKDLFVEDCLLSHRLFLPSTTLITDYLWHHIGAQFSPTFNQQRLTVEVLIRWMLACPTDIERFRCFKELFEKTKDSLKSANTLNLLQKLLRVHALTREVREVVLRRSSTIEPFHMRIYGEQQQQNNVESPGVFISHVDKDLCHAALYEADQVLELNGRPCEGAWATRLFSTGLASTELALSYNCAIELLNQATYVQLKVCQNWLGYYQLRRLLPRHTRTVTNSIPYYQQMDNPHSSTLDSYSTARSSQSQQYGRSAPSSPKATLRHPGESLNRENEGLVSVGRQQSWAGGDMSNVRSQYMSQQQNPVPTSEERNATLPNQGTTSNCQPGQQTPTLSNLKRMMLTRRKGTSGQAKGKNSTSELSDEFCNDPYSPSDSMIMLKSQELPMSYTFLMDSQNSCLSNDDGSNGVAHFTTMPRNFSKRQHQPVMPAIKPSALPTILQPLASKKSNKNSKSNTLYSSSMGRSEPDLSSTICGNDSIDSRTIPRGGGLSSGGTSKRSSGNKNLRRRERKSSGASSAGSVAAQDDHLIPDTAVKIYYRENQSSANSIYLLVHRFTRVQEIVMLALMEFSLSREKSSDYVLCECSIDPASRVKKQQILQPNITDVAQRCKPGHRLYLRHKVNPMASNSGSNSSIGNLVDDVDCQEMRRESQACLLDLNLPLLVRYLCEYMYQLYRAMGPRDLLEEMCGQASLLPGSVEDKSESVTGSEALQKIVEFSENMVHWVASEICRPGWMRTGQSRPWPSSAARRAKFLKRFIRLAKLALEWRNLQLFFDIMSGLESGPVSRLKQSWDRVPSKEVKLYHSQLRPLMSVSGNMRALRNLHIVHPVTLSQLFSPSTSYSTLLNTLSICLAEGNQFDLLVVDTFTRVILGGIPILALATKDLTVLQQVQETWISEETADPAVALSDSENRQSFTSNSVDSLRLSSISMGSEDGISIDSKSRKKPLVNFEKLRHMSRRIRMFYHFLHGDAETLCIQAWHCEDEASISLLQSMHVALSALKDSSNKEASSNPSSYTVSGPNTSNVVSVAQRRRSLPTMMAAMLGSSGIGLGGTFSGSASVSSSATLLPSAKKLFEHQWDMQRVKHYVHSLQIEKDPYKLREMSLCCEGGGNSSGTPSTSSLPSGSGTIPASMTTSQTLTLSPPTPGLSRSNSRDFSASMLSQTQAPANNPPSYSGSMTMLGRSPGQESVSSLRRGYASYNFDRINKTGSISSNDSGLASHSSHTTDSPNSSMRGEHGLSHHNSSTCSPRTSFRRNESSSNSSITTIHSVVSNGTEKDVDILQTSYL